MAADNPNTLAFDLEADVFTLSRKSGVVAFAVNGEVMVADLPSAKVDRETRDVSFMGRVGGKLDSSVDVEALASKLEGWYPPGRVIHAHDEADFENRKGNGIVVAKFSAEWCGPCKMVAPKIDAMSLKYPDVTFIHIDGEKIKPLMRKEGASCYPTFLFWKDGEKQATKIEGADAAKVEATIVGLGATAVEQSAPGEDEEVSIPVERDSFLLEKTAAGFSLSVNGKVVAPAGKCPALEINRDTRKVSLGRGGGVIFDSPDYNVEEVMNRIDEWFPNKVVHCHSTEEFDKIVSENANVVAKFSASWCGPCVQIAPFVAELSVKHENVVFVHIDVDQVKALSQREGVKAMPTFDFWQNGTKMTDKRVRGGDRAKLQEHVEAFGEN